MSTAHNTSNSAKKKPTAKRYTMSFYNPSNKRQCDHYITARSLSEAQRHGDALATIYKLFSYVVTEG